jgi:Flp pilus assembly pilin Flp
MESALRETSLVPKSATDAAVVEKRSFEMSSILRFIKEEEGAEIVEVGIWLALAVAASIAVIALIGPKILAGYNLLNAGLP